MPFGVRMLNSLNLPTMIKRKKAIATFSCDPYRCRTPGGGANDLSLPFLSGCLSRKLGHIDQWASLRWARAQDDRISLPTANLHWPSATSLAGVRNLHISIDLRSVPRKQIIWRFHRSPAFSSKQLEILSLLYIVKEGLHYYYPNSQSILRRIFPH